jgi:ATP-dependent Clp protease ATP-binding subunit ClpC
MQIDGYNFTKRMQATLWDAVAQAQALAHEYIGTEHLLLALVAKRDGCGAAALRGLGVNTEAAADRVLTIVQRGRGRYDASSAALLPFTSRSKKVLELAKEEAQALQHPLIGTEHLLLGMLAEAKGIAAQVLMDSGVDLEKARKQVIALREKTSDDDCGRDSEVPVGEPPAIVRVELEYMNGAIVSRQFTTTREATAFLEAEGRV